MENSNARPRIGERAVERQDQALAVVQRLLKERGIRSRCHHTIGLGLSAVRQEEGAAPADASLARFWLDRYPPELAVFGPRGRREAVVTVGPRSGSYLLRLWNAPEPQRCEEAEKVADLIATATAAT